VSLTPLGSWAEMKTTLLSPLYRGRITGEKGGCAAITLKATLDYSLYDHTAKGLVFAAALISVKDGKISHGP
jgi:hypothetical protein